MENFYVVKVPQDLLPQVTREILGFTTDANRVEIVHGPEGQVLHVDSLVAEAWLEFRREKEAADAAELQVEAPDGSGVGAEAPAPVVEPEPTPLPPAPAPEPKPAPAVEPTVMAPTTTPLPVATSKATASKAGKANES